MKRTLILLTALLLAPPTARGADPASVSDVRGFELARVRLLDGPFKTIQELHRTGLVGQLDPDRLSFHFRKLAGLPQPAATVKSYGGWDDGFLRGHYAGHYLSAAARMYAATGDKSFRDKANSMVQVLAECQAKLGGGYLSAFPAASFDRLENEPHRASVQYYTIHKIIAGLLDVAEFCDNKQALEVAAKMSDYFAARIAKLTPAQIEAMLRTDYTGNPVNEFGGMAEALTELSQLAAKQGDPNARRHLQLAAVFNRDWLIDPLVNGQDKLDGLHGNTHAAQVAGLARYALATGDERAGKAADAFWQLVTSGHSFVIGGNSFDEKLRAARTEVAGRGNAALSSATAETCATYNLLKLTRYLFQRQPQVRYADYLELALYNHILASIAPDTGHVTYFTPLRPGDFRTYLDGPYCCQGTGIEHTARFGEAIYFHHADTLWINLYISSTLDWHERGLKLRQETRYPETGMIRLIIDAAQAVPTTINLRIPAWVEGSVSLTVNGKKQEIDLHPGNFASITRRWQTGDAIELTLPLALRVRPAMDDPATISLFYGPVLLAGELGRADMPTTDIAGKDAYRKMPVSPVPYFRSATKLPVEPEAGHPLTFSAHMVNLVDQQEAIVRLSPLYHVHHQRFAVYWNVLTPEQARIAPRQPMAKEEGFVGNPSAEALHDFQGEKTNTGVFQGRHWRAAAAGGWFSYRLPVDANADVNLVCTYWGGETIRRVFDILIDDTKIGTQTLDRDKPGEFFDVAYRIPRELVQGKQFVIVRFQSQPGSMAGGLFSIRFEPAKKE